MNKCIIAIILVAIICSGCISWGGGRTDNRFELRDLLKTFDKRSHTFTKHDPGQNITINDKVSWIYYNRDMDRTLIIFKSVKTKALAFKGNETTNDLTSNYYIMRGDWVKVDIHIHRFSNGEETIKEWMY